MRIERHGMAVDVPRGWDARIYRREAGEPGGSVHPVLHAATFPLPTERGDFGSGAVEVMSTQDVFVSLITYDDDAADTALFRRRGMPRRLPANAFSPNRLQHVIPGQGGNQFFFTAGGRAYCLYVVLGSYADRHALLERAHALLDTVVLDTAEGGQ